MNHFGSDKFPPYGDDKINNEQFFLQRDYKMPAKWHKLIDSILLRWEKLFPKKLRKAVKLSIFIAIFLFPFYWWLRPVRHTEFYNLTSYNIQGNTALLVFNPQGQNQNIFNASGVARNSPHLLINIQTGRQIRLSYRPFHGLRVERLIREDRAVVRNRRNEIAIINPLTRQTIVPFGQFDAIGDTHSSDYIAIVYMITDTTNYHRWSTQRHAGVISLTTGEIIIEPDYFDRIYIIRGTDRFVMTTNLHHDFGRYRFGIFCLYTQTLITDLNFSPYFPQYQYGVIRLRTHQFESRFHYNVLISVPSGDVIIPYGSYNSISLINENAAIFQQARSGEYALINFRTGEVIIDYGQFEHISQSYRFNRLQNQNQIVVYLAKMGGFGIYNLNTHAIIWRQDVSDSEWFENIVMIGATINEWQVALYEVHARLNEYYDQVIYIGDGSFLVRDCARSRFVLAD